MSSTRKVRTNKEKHKLPRKKRQTKEARLRTLTYHSWNMMIERCYNVKHVSYAEYGGRGIKVCDEWLPSRQSGAPDGEDNTRLECFGRFIRTVGLRPSRRHTLDRRDPNGDYCPGNVRWATALEQGSNKRTTHYIRHPMSGERVAAAHVARELGLTYQQLRAKLVKEGKWFGLSFEQGVEDDKGTVVKELKP